MITFAHTTAKIAAWNLSGRYPIPKKRREEQVEALALLDADVVALVEINPKSVLETFKKGLRHKGVEYYSTCVKQENDLNIGALYKKGITPRNPRLLEGSDLGCDRHRKAFVVDLKVGQFKFTLIIVHLKSSRGRAEQQIRDRQAKVIRDFIMDLRKESPTRCILLVGDFNMIPGQDVSNFHHLGGSDVMDFISSWDLQDRYSHISDGGRANLLDGFAISRTYSTEYIRGSLRVAPIHWAMGREERGISLEKFRKEVSDHLPFVASFRIT